MTGIVLVVDWSERWECTYSVVAGVSTKLSGHGDSCAEEEDGIEQVENGGKDEMADPGVVPCGRDQVEEGQHAEDCNKHVVVDQGRIAGKGGGDDVANQGHDEESKEELAACETLEGIGGLV